jgi:hypothetical protein
MISVYRGAILDNVEVIQDLERYVQATKKNLSTEVIHDGRRSELLISPPHLDLNKPSPELGIAVTYDQMRAHEDQTVACFREELHEEALDIAQAYKRIIHRKLGDEELADNIGVRLTTTYRDEGQPGILNI